MSEYLIQDTAAAELANIAREITGTTEKINGANIAGQIREGLQTYVDTSTIADWSYYFYEGRRRELFEKCRFAAGVEFNNCFYNCTWITEAGTINLRNINGTASRCRNMFSGCSNLTSVTLQTGEDEATALESANLPRTFYQCAELTNLVIEGKIKVNDSNLNLAYSPKLTAESLASVISALVSNSTAQNPYTLYLGNANIEKLTEDQQAAIAKLNLRLG